MNTSSEQFYRQAAQLMRQNPPDYAAAVPLLRQAAVAGHAEAAFQLAACLMNGTGAAPDLSEAVGFLEQAAHSGHAYARFNLLQVRESRGEALEALLGGYSDLAQSGFAPAQWHLAKMYRERGMDKAAIKWAKAAAAQNHPQAQYFLAGYYRRVEGAGSLQALELCRQAADGGLAAAHWQLGLQYRFGQGVAQDAEKAAGYMRTAAEGGLAAAQTALAEMLSDKGDGEAVFWFQTASEQGDAGAHAALAQIYLEGRYAPRDYARARVHAQAAADCGNAEGLRLSGDIYRYGLGVAADDKKARSLYRRAAAAGSAAAGRRMLSESALGAEQHFARLKAEILSSQQAEQLYRQACAAYHGLNRPQNWAEASALYRRAAEAGHRGAQTELARMYCRLPGRMAEAVYWFGQAARQGCTEAQYCLAYLYFHGKGVVKNIVRACAYLQMAVEGGHPEKAALEAVLARWRRSAAAAEKKAV